VRREVSPYWGTRSVHEITKRDVVDLVSAIHQRGTPIAANEVLKTIKTFLRWCVGRAVLDLSPADGVPLPEKDVTRDRVLTEDELVRVILAARTIGDPYGAIVEFLALTGQRREEVARCTWDEIGLRARVWTLPASEQRTPTSHCSHV
jgi:integrase